VELATVVVLTGAFEASATGLLFARIAGLGIVIGAAVGWTAATINYYARGTQLLFALSLLAPYLAYFLAEQVGASGVLAVVIAGFVASWRIHYITPESRVELYSSWDHLSFMLNAVMFLFVGLETPHRLKQAIDTVPGILGIAVIVSVTVIGARLVWMFPAAYLPLWFSWRLRAREGGYPDARAVILGAWCGVRGAVSLAAALSIPVLLSDGEPFPGRAEIVACTLVVIVVTLIGQGVTLVPLVRRLGLSDADPADLEVHRAREAMLSAGIARLDAFCSEESCPIAVYRLREAMSDQLASLQSENGMVRTEALRRLAVDEDVRRAVYQAKTDALLSLREHGALNDRAHQQLQLDLDRTNADLREGSFRIASAGRAE
jgi:CPA1 family monovalent cation:H+ antiporter